MRNAILTISSAAKTATSGKFGAVLKSTLFAVLLAAASMAGAVPIPGTPVPITLQTFVVMLAALMLPWKQAGAAVLMYLAAGAALVCRCSPAARPPWLWSARAPASSSVSCRPPSSPRCSRARRVSIPEACCVDRRTVSVRLRGRLHRA